MFEKVLKTSLLILIFKGKDETNCAFRKYLERLKLVMMTKNGADLPECPANTLETNEQRRAIVHKCADRLTAKQKENGHEHGYGFSLSVYNLPNLQHLHEVI